MLMYDTNRLESKNTLLVLQIRHEFSKKNNGTSAEIPPLFVVAGLNWNLALLFRPLLLR